ncbi:MAG: Mitochondrial small ribosomal subunit Rsm22 [Lentisphaerae bacterium ADurb.BinA184]|nr:MAG: Mitochondrial small ribosomal subunit Rsm22 [Lentisphaerae bacterium ADurb.BinA184]
MNPGDEVRPELLDALDHFSRQWLAGPGRFDYTAKAADPRAYTCFFSTINMPKLWAMLDRTPWLTTGLPDTDWGLTELGCGPGTFLWATLIWLEQHAPDALARLTTVTGVDRLPRWLDLAQRLAAPLRTRRPFRHIDFRFVKADWREQLRRPGDWLIFGNVLNEAPTDDAAWVRCVEARTVLVIEPGTQAVFARLLPVRDAMRQAAWHVHFPCPRADTPCPMTAGNWCHFCVNRFQVPFVQRIAAKAARLNPRHNFCAFAFSRQPPPFEPAVSWRCLSHLRRANRSGIRWLCDGTHLGEALLNRHERTPANRPFLEADWGDLLAIRPPRPPAAHGPRTRLNHDETVTIVR